MYYVLSTILLCNTYYIQQLAHGTVLHKGKLYIFGGFDENVTFNDLYILDLNPERKSRRLQLPPPQLGPDLRTLLNNPLLSDVTFVGMLHFSLSSIFLF